MNLFCFSAVTLICPLGAALLFPLNVAAIPPQDWPRTLLCGYCILVMFSSVLGGLIPGFLRLTHTQMQLLISLVGGLMLGVGVLHQLPHAIAMLEHQSGHSAMDWCARWMLAGIVATFLMMRLFHVHTHEAPQPEDALLPPEGAELNQPDGLPIIGGAACGHDHDHDHDHRHDHDHDSGLTGSGHHHHHGHGHGHHHSGGVDGLTGGWLGLAFGMSIHTLLDGVALGSHVVADSLHQVDHPGWFPGIPTFLGIVLHKPLDSLSIIALMTAAGYSRRFRLLINFGYALMCPLGAALLYLGIAQLSGSPAWITSAALAFSAGVFLSIALSDLLPELEFHSHDRVKLFTSFLLGVVLAWAIGFLEPAHAHGHGSGGHGSATGTLDDQGHSSSNGGSRQPHDHGHDHGHDHKHEH